MKKFTYILFLNLLLQTLSFSQEEKWETQNYIGFHVSGITSTVFIIYNDPSIQVNVGNPYLNSFSGGLSFKNFSEKLVGLSVDLKYISKGGYAELSYNAESVAITPVLFRYIPKYLELSPLMNIRTGKKKSHINFYAGPHISWLLSDNIEFATGTETYKNTADTKFEFGLDAGVGYSFDLKKSFVELRFLYSHGLSNIFDPETTNSNYWFVQNQVFSANLAYYYKL
ncbi:MAG: PorT family protein [Bacteroidales bacterium]|nr:PorT family protein [Bacteroidales bacterium]